MRLPLILLIGLLAVPAALAAPSATGDGVLELKAVNATRAVIQGNRGAIWGQLDKGTLRVSDLNPDDNLFPLVSGAEFVAPSMVDPNVTIYSGKNIHFRFSGGKYTFSISGTGIDVTAVGVGRAVADRMRARSTTATTRSTTANGNRAVLKKLITFGVQPTVTSP